MNVLTFIAFQFYRFFSQRRSRVPYFSTLLAITVFLYVHFLVLISIFDQLSLISFSISDSKEEKWLKLILALIPFYIFCYYLVRKRDIEHFSNHFTDYVKLKRANTRLIIYILILLFLFAVMSIV